MPAGRKAPKLWPPEPSQSMVIEPSGRPSGCALVTWLPSIVPTQRFTLSMSAWKRMGSRRSRASAVYGMNSVESSVWSSSRSGAMLGRKWRPSAPGMLLPYSLVPLARTRERSTVLAFQLPSTSTWRRHSGWPTISSTVRKPRRAMISRSSSAVKRMKFSTCSGVPVKRPRRVQFCVAMPAGQVSCWQSRCMRQPMATSGMVAKPNSSAPSSAAMATSRPSMSLPSVSTTTRERRPLNSSVCCVSARPISNGMPAW